MPTFDQRGQHVTYQYNAEGNINFGAATAPADITAELRKLLNELTKASQNGAIDAETAIDVKAKVEKAVIQADKPNPNKENILDNINSAKGLIEGIASAVGLVRGFAQAAEMVRRLL